MNRQPRPSVEHHDVSRRALAVLLLVPLCPSFLPGTAVAAGGLSTLSRCGPMAMEVCASVCGAPITADDVDKHVEGDPDGCTLAELQRVGNLLGLRTIAVRWPGGLPVDGSVPAVIPVVMADGRQHFIALTACSAGKALIVDLPSRPAWVTEDFLRTKLKWSGDALHFASDDEAIANLRHHLQAARARRRDLALFSAGAVLAITAMLLAAATQIRRAQSSRFWRGIVECVH